MMQGGLEHEGAEEVPHREGPVRCGDRQVRVGELHGPAGGRCDMLEALAHLVGAVVGVGHAGEQGVMRGAAVGHGRRRGPPAEGVGGGGGIRGCGEGDQKVLRLERQVLHEVPHAPALAAGGAVEGGVGKLCHGSAQR